MQPLNGRWTKESFSFFNPARLWPSIQLHGLLTNIKQNNLAAKTIVICYTKTPINFQVTSPNKIQVFRSLFTTPSGSRNLKIF